MSAAMLNALWSQYLVVIEPYESQIDALVAAWLPGAEG